MFKKAVNFQSKSLEIPKDLRKLDFIYLDINLEFEPTTSKQDYDEDLIDFYKKEERDTPSKQELEDAFDRAYKQRSMLRKNMKHIQKNSNFGQLLKKGALQSNEQDIQDDAQFKKDIETELEKVLKNDQELKKLSLKEALKSIDSDIELKKQVLTKIVQNSKT